ncbi:alkaline shock response membrane anchor protein AmaP [Nocardia blacklockiae]|uniref:alkaline shock response membrane anchor protein AmaP n=1 Tax=Nocardia blacklockiae TaxID=480036 RepID=UPI001892D5BD|nr:alkaline shock response membrane anchor protein AmaP [Nocardia blacklockiae]MBF6174868.1 alkaline shock response membrane anchor protein AmaP [Nocardia blacklockiae]
MSTVNRPARLNRTLLALLGVALAAAGGYLIVAWTGRLSWADQNGTLVPGTAAPPLGVLIGIAAGAVLLGLVLLRWLAAQTTRLPRWTSWRIGDTDAAGTTVLDSGIAAEPVVADIEGYPQVRSVTARLSGPSGAPELHLVVTAEPDADLAALRRRILEHAVARLREALEVEIVPVTMELRLADRGRLARTR